MPPLAEAGSIVIVMPVYNDWASVARLIPLIDRALQSTSRRARVLIIDDASTEAAPTSWLTALSAIDAVSILHLRRNLGHQRAIAIGLVYVFQNWVDRDRDGLDALVIMDADGEDRPKDLPALLDAFAKRTDRGPGAVAQIVFAARAKRLEGIAFRFFYHAYRVLHQALTGVPVRVGNFSVMSPQALGRLMVVSELWNHYAAAVVRSRIPYTSIPIPRGQRLEGRSHMDFVSLLVHGLGAISVFSDIVGARLLALTALAMSLAVALIGAFTAVRVFTPLPIPAWAGYATGLLLIVLAQALIVSLALVFIIVSGRAAPAFLPIRDAPFFIDFAEQAYPAVAQSDE